MEEPGDLGLRRRSLDEPGDSQEWADQIRRQIGDRCLSADVAE